MSRADDRASAPVTIWYLEMADRGRLRSGEPPSETPALMRAEIPCPELGRFLYRAVGTGWCWTDRLEWTDERWRRQLEEAETWVAYLRGTPAGFFELRRHGDERVDIVLLGLLPWAIGRGLGRWLLTRAVERAWELGPRRVTVNTCSLDGPHALANYEARGFEVVRTETVGAEVATTEVATMEVATTEVAETEGVNIEVPGAGDRRGARTGPAERGADPAARP